MRDDLSPPHAEVRRAVAHALSEDLGALGDLTGSLVAERAVAHGAFVARSAGVIAGTSCLTTACALVDPALAIEVERGDGREVGAGDVVARIHGPFRSLLVAERTALNFLCHLSGIATLTRRFVDAATKANPRTRVLDTRKTTPGLRALEKAAVRAGGGWNHRASLSDAVLIKDNHLAGLSIEDAVATAIARWPGRTIEVECDTLVQVTRALDAGATIVMCDNMSPTEVHEAVALVREHSRGRSGDVLLEASGGITLDNVAAFAGAGADLISVGAITHSAPVLDIGLDLGH
ncbi:MAG: carboxylating nicotinate-nucleotide diphosphorylase [Acidimicrobiales bacterium]